MYEETVTRIKAALEANDGLLTVTSAGECGVGKSTLHRAVAAGVLKRTARDKYVAPGTASRVLAFRGAYLDQPAVLGFRGAWWYWGLAGLNKQVLEWCVPHGSRTSSEHVMQRRRFAQLEIVERDGVVVTSVRQTLLDIAARYDLDLVERAYEDALRKGLIDDIEMREWVRQHAGWQGAPGLRAVQARRRPGERPAGSDVAMIFLQVLRADGIDVIREWEVLDADGERVGFADFLVLPRACLFEVDGLDTHDVPNREHDYDRQGRMEDAGYLVRRVTAKTVMYRRRYLLQRVRRALAVAPPLEPMSSRLSGVVTEIRPKRSTRRDVDDTGSKAETWRDDQPVAG